MTRSIDFDVAPFTAGKLSVIIPIYNEEESIPALLTEVFPAFDALRTEYEVIFVDDGSADRSLAMLVEAQATRRDRMVVVTMEGNFGQHQALLAGFSFATGEYLVTLDADLQNPPSEVAKILAPMRAGHDYVGSIRNFRHDSLFRKWSSRLNNAIRERVTDIRITDQGCMLRGYHARVGQLMVRAQEATPYLPALGYSLSGHPTEVVVEHQARRHGESKYSFLKLLQLNFNIMTGYSLVPLQVFSFLGIVLSFISGAFFLLLLGRRIFLGPEAEGIFTLIALLFFFLGIILFGLGILGEYIGRMYSEVRRRPRFFIRNVWHDARPARDVTPPNLVHQP